LELGTDLGARLVKICAEIVGFKEVAHIVNVFIEVMVDRNLKAAPSHQVRRAAEKDSGQRKDDKVTDSEPDSNWELHKKRAQSKLIVGSAALRFVKPRLQIPIIASVHNRGL
jgi:hypothetical protein